MIIKMNVKVASDDEFMRCGSGKSKERIKFIKKNFRKYGDYHRQRHWGRPVDFSRQRQRKSYYVAAIKEIIFFRTSRRNVLPKIGTFKQYYVHKQELVYVAYDDIVDCGKGVRTQ